MSPISSLIPTTWAILQSQIRWPSSTLSILILMATAVLSLGTLELKIHKRRRSNQEKNATRLAAALRKGVLR